MAAGEAFAGVTVGELEFGAAAVLPAAPAPAPASSLRQRARLVASLESGEVAGGGEVALEISPLFLAGRTLMSDGNTRLSGSLGVLGGTSFVMGDGSFASSSFSARSCVNHAGWKRGIDAMIVIHYIFTDRAIIARGTCLLLSE